VAQTESFPSSVNDFTSLPDTVSRLVPNPPITEYDNGLPNTAQPVNMEQENDSYFGFRPSNDSRENDNGRLGSDSSSGSFNGEYDFAALPSFNSGQPPSSFNAESDLERYDLDTSYIVPFGANEFPSLSGDGNESGRSTFTGSDRASSLFDFSDLPGSTNALVDKSEYFSSSVSDSYSRLTDMSMVETESSYYPYGNIPDIPETVNDANGANFDDRTYITQSSMDAFSSSSIIEQGMYSFPPNQSSTNDARAENTDDENNSYFGFRPSSKAGVEEVAQTESFPSSVNDFTSLPDTVSRLVPNPPITEYDNGLPNTAQPVNMEQENDSYFGFRPSNDSRENDNGRLGSDSSSGSFNGEYDFAALPSFNSGQPPSSFNAESDLERYDLDTSYIVPFGANEFPSLSGDGNESGRSTFTGSDRE